MDKTYRHIDILLFNDLNILEVAGPAQVFATTNDLLGETYRLNYVSMSGSDVTTTCGLPLKVTKAAELSPNSQDLLIPGGYGVDAALKDTKLRDLITAWHQPENDRRIISVCSGSLLVANSGLLDGRKATTHWRRQQQAQNKFPTVNWAIDKLFCIDGPFYSSAGVSAGIDLALDIVRIDCGRGAALGVARQMVLHLKRDGGQSQFSEMLTAQFSANQELESLVSAILANPGHDWTLESMAEYARLSPRTLSRRFDRDFSTSPYKFLERVRVKTATDILSSGANTGKAIAVSGFSDFQQMQRAFKKHLGTTIGNYRNHFSTSEA